MTDKVQLVGYRATGSLTREDPEWLPVYSRPMNIGVTGGRFYGNFAKVKQTFDLLAVTDPTLVYGGASGADEYARLWAEDPLQVQHRPIRWKTKRFDADWGRACDNRCAHGPRRKRRDGSTFCPSAGPVRNQEMVDYGLDLLVAFPGGNGTLDMIRRAKAAEVLILRVEE
jgi:hypothetical protein